MLPPVKYVRSVSPWFAVSQRIASVRLFCGAPRSLSHSSICTWSVPCCPLTRAVMGFTPTTRHTPLPDASGEITSTNTGSLKASTPSWMDTRSEEHTSELQSRLHLVCRLLLEKKKRHRN